MTVEFSLLTLCPQGSLVLDAFYGPAIEEGVGSTSAMFFVDGDHSMVRQQAMVRQHSTTREHSMVSQHYMVRQHYM